MMKKQLLMLGGIVAVAAGLFVVFGPLKDTESTENGNARIRQYSWEITDAGTDEETGIPRTKVAFVIGGDDKRTIGTYDGTCVEIADSAWTLLENETSGVICWWAGGGTEIGLFQQDGRTEVKVGDLDEGSDEIPGFRGNFKTVFSVE